MIIYKMIKMIVTPSPHMYIHINLLLSSIDIRPFFVLTHPSNLRAFYDDANLLRTR